MCKPAFDKAMALEHTTFGEFQEGLQDKSLDCFTERRQIQQQDISKHDVVKSGT
jgi:hypothetical protein